MLITATARGIWVRQAENGSVQVGLPRRKLFLVGALLVSSVISFAQMLPIAGSYRYVPDDAVKDHCKRHKLQVPKGEIVLRDDRTFSLTINDSEGVHTTLGSYVVENDLVRFSVEEGLGRDLPSVMRLSKRGLNGKGAAYSRVVVKVQEGATVEKVVTPPAPPIDVAPPATDGIRGKTNGVWSVWRNGREDKTIRLTIRDGKFKCLMFMDGTLSSSGDVEYDDATNSFTLVYREVDGRPLSPDSFMRKKIYLEEEGTTFFIEKFQYRRKEG